MEFDWQGTVSSQKPEGSSDTCGSNMEATDTVPNRLGNGNTEDTHSPNYPNLNHIDSQSQQARHSTIPNPMGYLRN